MLFFNRKMQTENMNVTSNLPAEIDYAESLTEDSSAVSFFGKLELNPVIISTTRKKYPASKKHSKKWPML